MQNYILISILWYQKYADIVFRDGGSLNIKTSISTPDMGVGVRFIQNINIGCFAMFFYISKVF